MKSLLFLVSLSLFLPSLGYSAVSCSQAIEDLRQMKAAQLAVQGSLIKNHDMMAESMESYAEALKDSSGKAHKTVESSMVSAASSLRKRGEKGQELADQLAQKTDEIIKEVENCLK